MLMWIGAGLVLGTLIAWLVVEIGDFLKGGAANGKGSGEINEVRGVPVG